MAINSSAVEKYGALIEQSTPIRVGSPAVFQLRPDKTVVGSLMTLTIGQRNRNTLNKAVLVVGQTGTGKSTVINALVNYAMGVTWEDDVWFHIVKDQKKQNSQDPVNQEEDPDQCESKTSDVIVYQIFGFENNPLPFSLSIIDTPGYGDTRGLEHDKIVSNKLYEYFDSMEGITEIHVVGLVMKASDNRLDERLRYVFNSALSLFGKDMEKNIVAILTHSAAGTTKNALNALEKAKIKCARNKKNEPVHFLFNNCQDENRAEEPDDLQFAFGKSMRGMKEFTDFLGNVIPQKMTMTVDVLAERTRLEASIGNLIERIEFIEAKQAEIDQEKVLIDEFAKTMRENKVFQKTKNISYRVYASYEDHVVSCTVCKENCHISCSSVGVKCCKVMKKGKCTVCSSNCAVSEHVQEKKKYVLETKKETVTNEDMKRKYDESMVGKKNKEKALQDLELSMQTLEKEKDTWLNDAFDHIINLKEISLQADLFVAQSHLPFLIKKLEERKDEEKAEVLREIRDQVDEGTKAAIQYGQKAWKNPLNLLKKKW